MARYHVEIMNRVVGGRAVGNDWIVIDRGEGRSNVISHHGEDEADARRWADRLNTAVDPEYQPREVDLSAEITERARGRGPVTTVGREEKSRLPPGKYPKGWTAEDEAEHQASLRRRAEHVAVLSHQMAQPSALPPGKASCSVCGKVGSKANLRKHEAGCKSGKCSHGPTQGSLFGNRTPAEKDMAERIASERGDT